MSDRNEFIEAVGKYWDIAYEEGKAGRTHDTQDGQAQITWGRILDRYDALAARLAGAEARHRRVMSVIRPFCAKYTPDLLAEFDAAAADSASHRENERG